jgi:hypothetical protein
MRTLILALTVLLLAAPVWATVEITTDVDTEAKTITIGYTSDEGMVRAFALDIVATGGNIIAIGGYTAGDDNGTYGIFPGSFDDNIVVDGETGEVVSWTVAGYTPVAPSDDTDALGPIGGSQITIEMGSLYPEGGNAPPELSGDLCTITVDNDVNEVCITANAIRGSVVLEDANEPETLVVPSIPGETCVKMVEDIPCEFPTTPNYALQYADWVAYGKPDCWCNSAAILPGTPTQLGDYNCYGDANGDTEGVFKFRVALDDLNLIIDNWKLRMGGNPNPCADVDHRSEGVFKFRVALNDLNLIIDNWKARDSALDPNCPHPD